MAKDLHGQPSRVERRLQPARELERRLSLREQKLTRGAVFTEMPRASMNVSRPRSGPVAQLGARLNGIQEVTGSIPVRSTNSKSLISKT